MTNTPKHCETCKFWEIRRPNQFYGTCLNKNNYRVQKEFSDGCKLHEQVTPVINMHSQDRG